MTVERFRIIVVENHPSAAELQKAFNLVGDNYDLVKIVALPAPVTWVIFQHRSSR